jgi:hypothetical protein
MQNYIIKFYFLSWTVSERRYIQEGPIIIKIAVLPTCLIWEEISSSCDWQRVKGVLPFSVNLLQPTGYVTHQQFNIQQLYALLNVFCIHLTTNSDLCRLQHKLIGFYNRDEKCLQRGTDWAFK